MSRRFALAVSASLILAGTTPIRPAAGQDPPVEPYRARDRSSIALNILPPGQGRYLNGPEFLQYQGSGQLPPQNLDQHAMYEDLIQGLPSLDAQNLGNFFKDASFGVPGGQIARQYSPRPGVVVQRDRFSVPHIYGTTRGDTMFGAGYASAEDRLFMMDVLRHFGRGRLSEFLGASPANLQSDCLQYEVADYTNEELTAMAQVIPPGADVQLAQQAQQDLRDYISGINAYIAEARTDATKLPAEYPALQQTPRDWTVADSVAVASLIGGNLGVGGGGEVENAMFLKALQDEGYAPADARAILNDLRMTDDPEAPSSTDKSFPWNIDLGPVNPSSVAIPDAEPEDNDDVVADSCSGSSGPLPLPLPRTVDGPFGPIPLAFPDSSSNALLVGRGLSSNGRPLAVFGPQVAYWSPEILLELDMHGPGLHARGVGFPGISLYVLLGRGDGYGYSATSANGDQVDIRVVELCEPGGLPPTIDSRNYRRFDGQCVPIERRTDSWLAKPSAGGQGPPRQVTIITERVQLAGLPGSQGLRGGRWGIVQSRGTVGAKPVLFVRQRVTYGGEVDSAVAYVEAMDPDRINSAADFQRAFGRFSFTFNWFYVDDRDIAYQLGGSYPVRASGTDLDLPVWDGVPWGWQRLLAFEELPKDVSPAKGYMTSWNNKQAPGFRASDNNWGFAPIDRVLPLNDGIEAAANDGKVNMVELVRVMGTAATTDLRGYRLVPLLLDLMGDPGTNERRHILGLLDAWSDQGAHRRDLDGDGQYEHQAAIAFMDTWFPHVLSAVFGPVLGDAFDDAPYSGDNPPGASTPGNSATADHNGDAFNNGWYGQLDKDLRGVLGRPVQAPFSRGYCGVGSLAECRSSLIASLEPAIQELASRAGHTRDPSTWDAREVDDEIRYSPVGVVSVPPTEWQNRPTFQQVLEFRGEDEVGQAGLGGLSKVAAFCNEAPKGLTQILGTDGPDLLKGTKGPDVICSFGGRDRLLGLRGKDILIAGAGKDLLRGGGGKDLMAGQGGRDRLRGGEGNDVLNGGPGRDRCAGGRGADRLLRCDLRRR